MPESSWLRKKNTAIERQMSHVIKSSPLRKADIKPSELLRQPLCQTEASDQNQRSRQKPCAAYKNAPVSPVTCGSYKAVGRRSSSLPERQSDREVFCRSAYGPQTNGFALISSIQLSDSFSAVIGGRINYEASRGWVTFAIVVVSFIYWLTSHQECSLKPVLELGNCMILLDFPL